MKSLNKQLNTRHSIYFYSVLLLTALVVQILLALLLSSNSSSTAYWIVNGAYSLCLLVCGYIYCRVNGIDMLPQLRLAYAPKVVDVLWLCGVVFLLVNGATPINDWIVDIVASWGGTSGGIDSALVYDNIVLAVIVVCVIAPAVEELIFRGIIGNGLLSSGRVILAIIIGGLIFALFHMSLSQLLHQFVTGCVLMIFLWRSGSIWVPIIGHVFNNIIVLVLDYYVYSTGWYDSNGVWVAIVGVTMAIALVTAYILYTRTRHSYNKIECTTTATDKVIFGTAMAVSLLILVVGAI